VVSTTPRPLYPREIPGTHCTGGWVGPRAGLDVCEKSRPTRIRSPDRPARNQSTVNKHGRNNTVNKLGRMPYTNMAEMMLYTNKGRAGTAI
jgi:hypothetical protein